MPGPEARLAHAAERLAQHDGAGRDAIDVEIAGADVLASSNPTPARRGSRGRWSARSRSGSRARRLRPAARSASPPAPGRRTRSCACSCPGARRTSRPASTGTDCPSTGCGITAHSSPGSSTLSAVSRSPDGGLIIGPILVSSSHAEPTLRLCTASHSERRNAGSSYTSACSSSSDVAEHFWPEWLKAECRMCLMARSRSETAVTIVASLPPVSANRSSRGLSRQHGERGFGAAGQDHGVHLRVVDQLAALLAAGAGQELQRLLRHAGAPEALAHLPGDQHGVRGGLDDDRVAGRQRSRDATARNRDRGNSTAEPRPPRPSGAP